MTCHETAQGAPRRAPWGFVGMLALVLLVERGISRSAIDLGDAPGNDWRIQGKVAARYAGRNDVLGLGDSQVKLGIVPRIVERKAGLRMYNLAAIGGQAPTSYFLLKRALDSGSRPKAVIVDFMPTLLQKGLEYNATRWPKLLNPREGLDLAARARSVDLFASVLLARALPSVASRDELRAALNDALSGKLDERVRDARRYARNWSANRGTMILPPYPNKVDPAHWYRVDHPNDWSCDPLNAEYVERLLRLAESHAIAVYWLLPPIVPEAQALCREHGQEARFDRYLAQVARRHPDLRILDARRCGYLRDDFVDAVHLHRDSAPRLSSAVADRVAADLRAGRRRGYRIEIALGDAPADRPLEDIDASMAVVVREGVRR